MKLIYLIILTATNFTLLGQNLERDSLNIKMRKDAEWAIVHEDYSKAKEMLDKLILEEPDNPENYFVKSKIYYYQKNLDSLRTCLELALKFGNDTMRVYQEFLDYYLEQDKNYSERLKYINKIILLQPENSKYYLFRSSIWSSLGNSEESWKDLEKAASLGSEEAKRDIQEILETREKLKKKGIIQ